ncbi:hypothetical protein D3C85_1764150 [compost metagenome]
MLPPSSTEVLSVVRVAITSLVVSPTSTTPGSGLTIRNSKVLPGTLASATVAVTNPPSLKTSSPWIGAV